MNRFLYISTTLAAAALTSAAAAQSCVPGWDVVPGYPNSWSDAMAVMTEENHEVLFVGGAFSAAGGIATGPVARWDGFNWSAVGNDRITNSVYAMTVFDDGRGPALYVGGNLLSLASNPAATGVARWDGAAWEMAGDVLIGGIGALAVHDDGTGAALYAGGNYWSPVHGQFGERSLMKLTGGVWQPVGGGVGGGVRSLLSFDDGTGRSLYVSGSFITPSAFMVRWDGSQWHDLRGSRDSISGKLISFDRGAGPELFLAGISHNPTTRGLFRWNRSDWVTVGTMETLPLSVAAWDDGAGPALYLGGAFQFVNGSPMNLVAKWDGEVWSSTGAQVLEEGEASVLMPFIEGDVPVLYAGGIFNQHQPSRYMVRYTTCNHPGPCYPNCDGSTVEPALNIDDFVCFISEFAAGHLLPHSQQVEHYANCDGSAAAPVLNVDDFTCFINEFAAGCE